MAERNELSPIFYRLKYPLTFFKFFSFINSDYELYSENGLIQKMEKWGMKYDLKKNYSILSQ
jgi:hypothetical protein